MRIIAPLLLPCGRRLGVSAKRSMSGHHTRNVRESWAEDAKPDKNDCRTGKRISTSCRQNRRGLRHIAIKEHRHLTFKMTPPLPLALSSHAGPLSLVRSFRRRTILDRSRLPFRARFILETSISASRSRLWRNPTAPMRRSWRRPRRARVNCWPRSSWSGSPGKPRRPPPLSQRPP